MNWSLISVITAVGAGGALAYMCSLRLLVSRYKTLWEKEKEINQEREKKALEERIKFLEAENTRLKPYQNYHHQMLNKINFLINQNTQLNVALNKKYHFVSPGNVSQPRNIRFQKPFSHHKQPHKIEKDINVTL